MQLVKLNEEQLKNICEPLTLQRAENYVGKFSDCKVEGTTLTGKIKGNHGVYSVILHIDSDPITYTCDCDKSHAYFCKHAAALGLTYIYTPWVFATDRTLDRNDISSFDDLSFFVRSTTLKSLMEDLKKQNVGVSVISEVTGVPVQQVSSILKDEAAGKHHVLTDPLKLSCMLLLDKGL